MRTNNPEDFGTIYELGKLLTTADQKAPYVHTSPPPPPIPFPGRPLTITELSLARDEIIPLAQETLQALFRISSFPMPFNSDRLLGSWRCYVRAESPLKTYHFSLVSADESGMPQELIERAHITEVLSYQGPYLYVPKNEDGIKIPVYNTDRVVTEIKDFLHRLQEKALS